MQLGKDSEAHEIVFSFDEHVFMRTPVKQMKAWQKFLDAFAKKGSENNKFKASHAKAVAEARTEIVGQLCRRCCVHARSGGLGVLKSVGIRVTVRVTVTLRVRVTKRGRRDLQRGEL